MTATLFWLRCYAQVDAEFPLLSLEFIIYGKEHADVEHTGRRYIEWYVGQCAPPPARTHISPAAPVPSSITSGTQTEEVNWGLLAEEVKRFRQRNPEECGAIFTSLVSSRSMVAEVDETDAEELLDPNAATIKRESRKPQEPGVFLASGYSPTRHEREGVPALVRSNFLDAASELFRELNPQLRDTMTTVCPPIYPGDRFRAETSFPNAP